MTIDKQKFQELLAKARAISAAANETAEVAAADNLATTVNNTPNLTIDLTAAGINAETLKTDVGSDTAVEVIRDVISNISTQASSDTNKKTIGVARVVTLNSKQESFDDTVQSGKSCVLIGSAGTGKTTCTGVSTKNLVASGRIKPLTSGTKYLTIGKPGIAILSYTRKAVNNIRHAVADEFKSHTLTIHKLLEFAPIFYEIEDKTAGGFKNTMRFEPQKCRSNPLPSELTTIIIEEASMVSVELYELLEDAMPHRHQEIFLGDIQQLPPVFGLAILGFKMLELPVIELTEVYRQALDSPIISLAWKILGGNSHDFSARTETKTQWNEHLKKDVARKNCPALDKFTKETDAGTVKFQIWQKTLGDDLALITFRKQITTWADQGYYNPKEDVILCPYNKAFGTIEINKGIAQHLGRQRKATVYEVIAGFEKHYLAVGDRVLYDKEDAVITKINRNAEYLGKRPQTPSEYLDRWGAMQAELSEADKFILEEQETEEMDMSAIERFMESAADSSEERVQAASHVIHIKLAYQDDEDREIELSKASEINNLLGGYALTIHKFQGSEAERVFLVFHDSHVKMISRELLYTAVTRAKKFLHIICETNTFEKGVKSQRIKGDTLQQKAHFFQGEASKRDKDLKIAEKLKTLDEENVV